MGLEKFYLVFLAVYFIFYLGCLSFGHYYTLYSFGYYCFFFSAASVSLRYCLLVVEGVGMTFQDVWDKVWRGRGPGIMLGNGQGVYACDIDIGKSYT